MFGIALAFCAGVAAWHASPATWPVATAAVPALAAALLARRTPGLAAALAGFAWSLALASIWIGDGWPCTRDREAVTLTGLVLAPPLEREGRVDFDLEVLQERADGEWPRRVRLSWYEAERRLLPGEIVRCQARLRCRRGFANPGAPDRELALLRERIDATGYATAVDPPSRGVGPPQRPIERMRARVAHAIARALPPGPSVAVLQGLSVGVRGTIPDSLWSAFSTTGIAHLIAISGLHVTGCAVFVLALLRLAWRLRPLARLPGRLAIEAVTVVAVTATYALLSGGSLPALRTLAMVAAFAALRLMRRSWPLHHLLALAALVLVAMDPLAITSAGFWLSFVATAALLAACARAAGWRGRLAGFARAQLSITALLAPVLAAFFGRLSIVAPAVNAVAIPVFSLLILPAVLAATALAALAPESTPFLWRALARGLDGAWPILESVARLPYASWSPAAQPVILVAATAALLFVALLLPIAGVRCAAAALLSAMILGRAGRPSEGEFVLTAVDVGQGLAAVVQTARHVLVFDTGARWRGGGTAARVSLLPFLRARGIRRIDQLVISHDDLDHAGGADALAQSFDVRRRMASADSERAAESGCRRGARWRWDGIDFLVLHPPAGFQGGDNDRSCAIAVSGPGGTALLLADPEARAESALRGQPVAADVVLLPHHGSRSSSSAGLVAAVGARVGIASAGFGNRWDMPHGDAVARWRAAGTTVLVTAHEGAVHVRFPRARGAVEIETERRKAPHWWRGGAGG